jgi:HD superfamily phosphohydrolase
MNPENAISEVPERTPFAHLEPTVRRVSRLNIETKWEPLPPGCVSQVSILLSELQKPIIARLKEDRKKTHVSVALKSVSRKLLKKLSMGLPFPPAINRTREDDFDFEKILDNSRALESQLTTTIHANKLLEAELRKEMARLESDQQNLADLEANAKRESTLRKEQARSLHSLLQADILSKAGDYHLDVGLEEKKVSQSLDASVRFSRLILGNYS